MSPAVACVPAGGVCCRMSSLTSSSEAAALLQGEEDGRPGTVVLSNPADGRAMPLVRGEGNPAACPPPQGSYQESTLLLVIGRSLLMRVHSSPRLEKILRPI